MMGKKSKNVARKTRRERRKEWDEKGFRVLCTLARMAGMPEKVWSKYANCSLYARWSRRHAARRAIDNYGKEAKTIYPYLYPFDQEDWWWYFNNDPYKEHEVN